MHSARNIAEKLTSIINKLTHRKDSKGSLHQRLISSSTEDHLQKPKPRRPRRGWVAMYVGEEAKRYEVPIKFLSVQSFQQLLIMRSEEDEDVEFKIGGPIRVYCSTSFFDEQLRNLAKAV